MAVAQHCGLDSKAVLEAKSADVKRCDCFVNSLIGPMLLNRCHAFR
jgi:hypothetical protein